MFGSWKRGDINREGILEAVFALLISDVSYFILISMCILGDTLKFKPLFWIFLSLSYLQKTNCILQLLKAASYILLSIAGKTTWYVLHKHNWKLCVRFQDLETGHGENCLYFCLSIWQKIITAEIWLRLCKSLKALNNLMQYLGLV